MGWQRAGTKDPLCRFWGWCCGRWAVRFPLSLIWWDEANKLQKPGTVVQIRELSLLFLQTVILPQLCSRLSQPRFFPCGSTFLRLLIAFPVTARFFCSSWLLVDQPSHFHSHNSPYCSKEATKGKSYLSKLWDGACLLDEKDQEALCK